MRTRRAVGVVVALTVLGGCGTRTDSSSSDPSGVPTGSPTEPAAATGLVTTSHPVTVLDDGDGAELCLGGVAESLPPQCGGPRLLGVALERPRR